MTGLERRLLAEGQLQLLIDFSLLLQLLLEEAVFVLQLLGFCFGDGQLKSSSQLLQLLIQGSDLLLDFVEHCPQLVQF